MLELLQPSVDPLLSLLPWGSSPQGRELLMADRLRAVLKPLVDAGHIVVVQSAGLDSAEGEAVVGAADLGLIVVSTGRTLSRDLAQMTTRADIATELVALVVDPRMASSRGRHPVEDPDMATDVEESIEQPRTGRTPR